MGIRRKEGKVWLIMIIVLLIHVWILVDIDVIDIHDVDHLKLRL